MFFDIKVEQKLVDYNVAHTFMSDYVEKIIDQHLPNLLWLLEHPPLYTSGTSSDPQDISNPFNLPVYDVGRGGQYTYHGPGQRICYILFNLKQVFHPKHPDLKQFIYLLEEVIIHTLKSYNIIGERRTGRTGIWVIDKKGIEAKIAAIGIRVKKWVSYHGIAININPDLKYFSGIIPCGIKDYGVISMKEFGCEVDQKQFDTRLVHNFQKIFRKSSN